MQIEDPYEIALNMARILTTEELGDALEELEDGDGSWFIFFGGLDVYINTETAIKAARDELAERSSREAVHLSTDYDS
jgi:hypothetical protein